MTGDNIFWAVFGISVARIAYMAWELVPNRFKKDEIADASEREEKINPGNWEKFNDTKYLEFLFDNGAILYMDSDLIRKRQQPAMLVMSFCAAGMAEIDSDGHTIVVTSDRNKAGLLHRHLAEYYDGNRIPFEAEGHA